jgi:hypothetical protein
MSTPSAATDTVDSAHRDPASFALARSFAKRQGLLATPTRKLVFALIASLLVHLLFGTFIDVDPPDEKFVPLKAQFMKLPPPPTAPVAAATPPKPKPKPRPKPQPNAAVAALPTVDNSPVATVPVDAVAEKKDEPAPEAKPEPAPEPTPEPVAEKKEAPIAPPASLDPPGQLPPKKIQLAYAVSLGEGKSEIGPVQLTFTHEQGKYKLKISGRARGIAALLYPGAFTGESEGAITKDGLRPDRYIEERGTPDKRREASFDHVEKKVTIPEKEPLAFDGAPHDPLTWIVQFYFAMPKGEQATFTVASTRRVDVYTMARTGKDNIATPVGNVDVQLWKGTRKPRADGSGAGGSAQFWLAPEWHFVPFQVKLVDARGRSAYFELTAINTE